MSIGGVVDSASDRQPIRISMGGKRNVRTDPEQTWLDRQRQCTAGIAEHYTRATPRTTRLGPFDADQRGGSSLEGSTSCNRSRCAVLEDRRENADTLILEHTCRCARDADTRQSSLKLNS